MRKPDHGFTLIELLIVVAIISIIASVAVPGLLRSKMSANEASALASMRTIAAAQVAYSTTCGNGAYASSLVTLGTGTPGTPHTFISMDLGGSVAPVKSGYVFTLAPGAGSVAGQNDCNGTGTVTTYYATALPQTYGTTGARSFAVTASNTVWQTTTAAAPTEPFGAPSTPAQ
jgi:type IV pilus assembly protein PilA